MDTPRPEIDLIAPQDAAAFEVIGGGIGTGVLLLCDHAKNTIPEMYNLLGIQPEQLERHIAHDIGAEGVMRRIAQRLGAPGVLSKFSRLLIDPNRGTDDPTLIMRLSDGVIIPGNRNVDGEERARRLDQYYRPYHQAIDATIDAFIARDVVPIILSIHSFTDNWRGKERQWHAGVLWDRDPRLAARLLKEFDGFGDLVVGDNQPYSGALRGDTLWQHGMMRGVASAIVEIRQDLIGHVAGQELWGDRLATMIENILAQPGAGSELNRESDYSSSEDRVLAMRLGLNAR